MQFRHLVDRIKVETIRLQNPDLAEVLIGREAAEGIETRAKS